MPEPIRKDLAALEQLDDEALRHVAQGVWSPEQSARYTELLEKERAATITPSEKATLEELYHEANCHMLRKAYANALLKWCGHPRLSLADLEAAR